MKKAYIINKIEHTFEFGKHKNGMDILKDNYLEDGKAVTMWTTVFDVLPQNDHEADRMLKSNEWCPDKNEIVL